MNDKLRELRLLVRGYSGCMNEAAKINQLEAIENHVLNSIPKHETVEQWEARTGEIYPNDGPVWGIHSDVNFPGDYQWGLRTHVRYSKKKEYVANHHGKPEAT